jgi:purine nucleosidase
MKRIHLDTNLYLFERQYPGILLQADLYLMGGYVYPIRPGFPDWDNDSDWNIQVDVRSARHVLHNSWSTLIPLTVTVETVLHRTHLDALRGTGALGQLIERQAEALAVDERMDTRFRRSCPGLPDDIINFQHDELACAIALGWDDGVEIVERPLIVEESDGLLTERVDAAGKPAHIVSEVDGPRFNEFWLDQVRQG